MLIRLTEAQPNKTYEVFTIELPQQTLNYYMNAGIFHGSIITLLYPFNNQHVRVDTGEYRYLIANNLASNIIVQDNDR